MSAEIETVKRIFDGINQLNIPVVLECFDPSVVRVEPQGFPNAGTYRGLSEVRDHFEKGGRSKWAEGSCLPEKFEIYGDKIVAFVHVHVRLKDQTEWIDGRMADVFTFRNGKVIEMRSFAESEEAVKWAKS